MKCPRCNGTGEVADNAVHFGDLIRHRRDELNMRQEDLASAVGLSRGQIANLETGRTDTSIKKLALFAVALKCSVKDLVP